MRRPRAPSYRARICQHTVAILAQGIGSQVVCRVPRQFRLDHSVLSSSIALPSFEFVRRACAAIVPSPPWHRRRRQKRAAARAALSQHLGCMHSAPIAPRSCRTRGVIISREFVSWHPECVHSVPIASRRCRARGVIISKAFERCCLDTAPIERLLEARA